MQENSANPVIDIHFLSRFTVAFTLALNQSAFLVNQGVGRSLRSLSPEKDQDLAGCLPHVIMGRTCILSQTQIV